MKLPVLVLFLLLVKTIHSRSNLNFKQLGESLQDALNQMTNKLEIHPDAGLNITTYLAKYNYPLESHEVPTEDGFFLTLHRIPHGRNNSSTNVVGTANPAVLLVHGLMCSSYDWVYTGPNSSLALILADTGYDVWLVSTRGTTPSSKHKSLNMSDADFWDYSWHEKGYYDLAASVDYIINETKLKKITLIGHSEGTTDSLVLTSSRPEYNDKINLMVLLSPIAYMDGVTSPLVILMVKYMEVLQLLFKTLNINGVPYSPLITSLGDAFCDDGSLFQPVCANFIELLCGYDSAQLDKSLLTVVMSNTPAGFSVKELIHYGQEIRSGYFRQYDYDLANIFHYGSKDPPSYDVTKITAQVATYYAQNDFFASTEDVEKLLDQLQNKVDTYLVKYELFNHLDFILAKDVKTLLYDRVISVIQTYNPLNI